MPTFTPIPYPAFIDDIAALAAAITADATWKPSMLVGIGRGGLVPAVYLSHATGLPMLSCDWSSAPDAIVDDVIARLAGQTRAGERLLLIDDINDSGKTIAAIRRALADAGSEPKAVRFATLIDNSRSAARVDYRARTIDRAIVKDWFVFPWESLASPEAITAAAEAEPSRTG